MLANELTALRDTRDLVIFALPRGGVPIAAEISAALDRPLHVLVVRKLGVPGHEEVAMGAIAPGGICILSQELIDTLGISKSQINALIADELALYFALTQFLIHEGIRVPHEVSLACVDHDPHFRWCKPTVAHVSWNASLVASRVMRWVHHLAQGKDDRKLTTIKTRFLDGESLGPPPSS